MGHVVCSFGSLFEIQPLRRIRPRRKKKCLADCSARSCFLLVSHECVALTCHDSRLFVCFCVCHAANDPETYNDACCAPGGAAGRRKTEAVASAEIFRCMHRSAEPSLPTSPSAH